MFVKNKMLSNNNINFKDFGERIRKIRKDQCLTQAEFAGKIKISRGHLAALEVGKVGFSSVVKYSICNVFAVREQWLLYGEEPTYDDRWALLEERAKELGADTHERFLLLKATKKRYEEVTELMPAVSPGEVREAPAPYGVKAQPVADKEREYIDKLTMIFRSKDEETIKAITQNIDQFLRVPNKVLEEKLKKEGAGD